MQYEPFKEFAEKFLKKSTFIRKLFYFFLNLLFLRSWHLHKALRKISKMLPSDSNVLDAGSGLGQHSWWMARKNSGWKIKGIDIITEQVSGCNEFFIKEGMGSRVSFVTADLTEFQEENLYNLIISVDVMEHIKNDIQVFRNFFNALKPGGVLLITTPSNMGGSGITAGSPSSFIDEHVRNGYGKEEIQLKLQAAGFNKTTSEYTYGKLGHLSWLISIKYPALLINKSGLFFAILPFYYILTLPFALILNLTDLKIKHNSGTGLLVFSVK